MRLATLTQLALGVGRPRPGRQEKLISEMIALSSDRPGLSRWPKWSAAFFSLPAANESGQMVD
jgi:hypothetical protein